MDRISSARCSRINRPQVVITIKYDGTTATIGLTGELDIAVVNDVLEVVKLVIDRDGLAAIRVDVSKVTFIDSTGLMILIRARQFAHDYLLTFALAGGGTGPVARLLTLSGLSTWFAETRPDQEPDPVL